MKSQISFPEQTSANIKNRSLNLFNINNLIQQQKIQQLHQQHLIQQQIIKQQLQNQNQSNFNNFINYQIENATQNMEVQEQLSPSDLKIQSMFIDQQALIQSHGSPSLNTSSCSSTIELPIINQSNNTNIQQQQQQQYSPMNTSSYEISPISTPTTVDSPISCSSPISNYSQSSSTQCTNQQIINQTSINTSIKSTINAQNLSTTNLINQLINQKQPIKKSTKINLTINKIDQNMLLVDNPLPKKRMRKTPIKRINKTNQIKQINSTEYILELEKNKLNFDESSCSSNSMNSEYCNLNKKTIIDPKKRRQRQQANERERKRMNSINKAFDVLKDKLLPETINHKLSKMEILKLAQSYIKELEDQLKVTKPLNQFIQSEISTV